MINFITTGRTDFIVRSIEEKVLKELKWARYSIWISDIWFTEARIRNMLMNKLRMGVNVEVVLAENKLESSPRFSFEEFTQAGGELFFVPNELLSNFTPEKFCIIDSNRIIQAQVCKIGESEKLPEHIETIVEDYTKQYLHTKNCLAYSIL